ncbi:unnamed protein product [Rotaria socialis]|uniref:Uncharacterized protein n=3 Tax=Rotaria socialis TaxID=392032 RepID=A0A817XTZ4_9BILA|nr:unnamed protein product [Rotaria socialis]CAF4192530.1 unnamed protein product [Rotaria socialis]CAF4518826.1 unnamed protein product [Rotaria socialis]
MGRGARQGDLGSYRMILLDKDLEWVLGTIFERANLVTASSRTVLLMDATGSMSSLLSAAKETVCTMFERAASILSEKGLPNDAFQMQFVVYRDYDCKSEGILQSSSWETKPIAAMGGGDYEDAIEVGLWYAVQESE